MGSSVYKFRLPSASLVVAISLCLHLAYCFEYIGQYDGDPMARPLQSGCSSGLVYQNEVGRQFVLAAYRNGMKVPLDHAHLPNRAHYVALLFHGFGGTPGNILGDRTDGGSSRLYNTRPFFVRLSNLNRTVLVLSFAGCVEGKDAPCAASTTGQNATCSKAWNAVISKSYNHLKQNDSAPLCTIPRKGCDALRTPYKCEVYKYPPRHAGTPAYCSYEYSCADDTQMVSDALDWLIRLVGSATPKFLIGFSEGAQLSMTIACDARILDKVSAVIGQHGSPSGDYCCWDNPYSGIAKRRHKLVGFLHIGGQQGVDTCLPTYCETQDLGYCSAEGYTYSSAVGNLRCWNETLGLNAHLEKCTVPLDTGKPFNRGLSISMDYGHTSCQQLRGFNLIACKSHIGHLFDPFFTTIMANYVEYVAAGIVLDLNKYGTCGPWS